MSEVTVLGKKEDYQIEVGVGGHLLLVHGEEKAVHLIYGDENHYWCPPYINRKEVLAVFKTLYLENKVNIERMVQDEVKLQRS